MRYLIKFALVAVFLASGLTAGGYSARAQIPAPLPDKSTVAKGQASPVDGTYTISTIGKRVTIEQGRAYAIDPWIHAMIYKIQPNMVVLDNFRQTGPDRYEGDDLVLMGKAVLLRRADGSLDETVAGAFGPASFRLIPTRFAAGPPVETAPVQQDRVYDLHVSVVSCDGWSLLRKNYQGYFTISVKNSAGKVVKSDYRNFHVKCTKNGPRNQDFSHDPAEPAGKGSLTMRIPPGQEGFSNLVIAGTLHDLLGPVPFSLGQSPLLLKARNMRRDLNVGESIDSVEQIVGGKARLLFRVVMKRVQ